MSFIRFLFRAEPNPQRTLPLRRLRACLLPAVAACDWRLVLCSCTLAAYSEQQQVMRASEPKTSKCTRWPSVLPAYSTNMSAVSSQQCREETGHRTQDTGHRVLVLAQGGAQLPPTGTPCFRALAPPRSIL